MSDYLWLGWGVGALAALVIWLVAIPIGLSGVFDALGVQRSRAWVPFVNLATVYRLGGLSEYWLVVLVTPPTWIIGMIMLIVASHRITRRLDHSGWFTVLAVVMWWVWALAVGLQHEGGRSRMSEPLVWAVARPEAALRLPSAEDETPSASFPLLERLGVAPDEAIAPELPLLAPDEASAPTVPGLATGDAGVPAMPPIVLGDAAVPATPQQPQPAADDDATILSRGSADATVLSPRRRPNWWLETSTGSRVELLGTAAILGRRPRAHPLYPGAQLVVVSDDAVSVSANHAVLEYVEGDWHVTDLGSTNGVWLVDPTTGVEREIGVHNRHRITPRFLLGELGVQVVRSA